MRSTTLVLAMLPTPALALDCLVPTLGEMARGLMDAGVPHVVIRGELRYLPGQDFANAMADNSIDIKARATLTGRPMTAQGYGAEITVDVINHHACFAPWCDGPFTGATVDDAVFVMTKQNGVLWFETGMCAFNGYTFSPELEAELLACIREETTCEPEW